MASLKNYKLRFCNYCRDKTPSLRQAGVLPLNKGRIWAGAEMKGKEQKAKDKEPKLRLWVGQGILRSLKVDIILRLPELQIKASGISFSILCVFFAFERFDGLRPV